MTWQMADGRWPIHHVVSICHLHSALCHLVVVCLLIAGCRSKTEPAPEPRQTLPPLTLPDLARAAPPVQSQLRERYASLTEKQTQPGTPAAVLGTEYGEMGKVLMAAEFRDQAEVAFPHAEALAPGDMRWPYYLAHLYKVRGDTSKSAAAFERALRLAPDDVPTMIWLGNAKLDGGAPDAAESLFTKALSLQPRSVAARYGLGRAALAKQDYARAVQNLEQALALDEKGSIIHYALAMAYRGLGDREKAEAHLRQRGTVQITPDDPLMKELEEMLHSPLAYEVAGAAALDKGDWAAAAAFFRKGIALAPKEASLHHKLGTALFVTGDAQGAANEFEQAVRLSPRFAKAHYSLGVMFESLGQPSQAIAHLSAAVKAEPDYAEARLQLAHALRRSGQLVLSLGQYEQIFKIDPRVAEAHFGHAAALIGLKRFQEARDRLTDWMRLYPDEPAFVRAMARLLAAAPDDRVRDGRRALALAQELLGRQPRNIELHETLAMSAAEAGQYDEAARWQREAIDAAARLGRRDLAARLGENLKLYQAHRPCRTPWRADEPIEFFSSPDTPGDGPRS